MRRAPMAACLLVVALAAGCGGDDDAGGEDGGAQQRQGLVGRDRTTGPAPKLEGESVTAWTNEWQPDRMRKTRRILADFRQRTGARVKLVAVPEDGLTGRLAAAQSTRRLPDVVFATSMAQSQSWARSGVFDADAAQEVLERLGPGTFSGKAVDLVSAGGKATGVPSDGWGQLLIYRRDVFDEAGIPAPGTVEDVWAAAAKVDRPGMAGITLATAPRDNFTHESFEHLALAFGCELVGGSGRVTFDSPPCIEALRFYADLARRFSIDGVQDVDSTREAYFAGRTAMIFWSPFLLDGMAGLRDDIRPTCPECRRDPAFLARSSGLVGPLSKAGGKASQLGSVSTFNITVGANKPVAQALVEFMMSDGYVRWLGLSPQGKFPVRFGDESDPQRFVLSWLELESGVERKARLTDFYSRASIESLGEGVERFERWGFAEGQGALIGALSVQQPISRAVAAVVGGEDPARVAAVAQRRIEAIQAGL